MINLKDSMDTHIKMIVDDLYGRKTQIQLNRSNMTRFLKRIMITGMATSSEKIYELMETERAEGFNCHTNSKECEVRNEIVAKAHEVMQECISLFAKESPYRDEKALFKIDVDMLVKGPTEVKEFLKKGGK